ncbi:MAG: hypothetical protein GF315_01865 [candidate division Zixibacteria bacterium]|nr:hypothetical protein [candidate division Zixibacteria bacterium]
MLKKNLCRMIQGKSLWPTISIAALTYRIKRTGVATDHTRINDIPDQDMLTPHSSGINYTTYRSKP